MCVKTSDKDKNWVVRLVRRDNESRYYWYDRKANINSRVSSAMKMDKDTAIDFAKAINDQCKEYKARAYRYETSVAQKEAQLAATKADRKPDALKSEEQVELEELRAENVKLKMQVAQLENFIHTITMQTTSEDKEDAGSKE